MTFEERLDDVVAAVQDGARALQSLAQSADCLVELAREALDLAYPPEPPTVERTFQS